MRSDDTKCPHGNIVHCPLYVAAHEGDGLGCDDGHMGFEGCAIDRGADYNQMVAKLCRKNPAMVRECADRENAELARQQRARNMRAAGIH